MFAYCNCQFLTYIAHSYKSVTDLVRQQFGSLIHFFIITVNAQIVNEYHSKSYCFDGKQRVVLCNNNMKVSIMEIFYEINCESTMAKKINIREYRRDQQEWTIQRHWQHCAHKTREEVKQSKTKYNTTQKTKKDEHHRLHQKTGVDPGAKGRNFLSVIKKLHRN